MNKMLKTTFIAFTKESIGAISTLNEICDYYTKENIPEDYYFIVYMNTWTFHEMLRDLQNTNQLDELQYNSDYDIFLIRGIPFFIDDTIINGLVRSEIGENLNELIINAKNKLKVEGKND